MVEFREDPNRWGGCFGPIPCGEAVLTGDLSVCDGYVLRCNCVAADHRVENPVDCGCSEVPSWLNAVVGPTGKDKTAAQAEGGRIDDGVS